MKRPARMTLTKAVASGEYAPPSLACMMAAEGLRRDGYDVYVLPKHAGGSDMPAYLVIETTKKRAESIAELCPDAIIVVDGVLSLASFEYRDGFMQQWIKWPERRWTGGKYDRAISAPAIEVGFGYVGADRSYGWHIRRGLGKASVWGADRLRRWTVGVAWNSGGTLSYANEAYGRIYPDGTINVTGGQEFLSIPGVWNDALDVVRDAWRIAHEVKWKGL